MTTSEQLDNKVRLLSLPLASMRQRFWSHARVADLFPRLLYRMYCEARATEHLLEAALDRLELLPEDDPLAPEMIGYLRRQIVEERGHDVWLLDSLEALGIPSEEVLKRPPAPTTAAMVGAQYYYLYHHHPVALLGYIKIAENAPSDADDIGRCIEATGLPREAFKYHLMHVDLEPAHNAELDRLLDSLPLTEEQVNMIGINAGRTLYLMAQSLEEILTVFDSGIPAPSGSSDLLTAQSLH